MLYVTPFLDKTSLSKSFCSLILGFQTAVYDASKFFLVLAFFRPFEMTAHLKQWLMLLQRCFDGSELLVKLSCSSHLVFELRLVALSWSGAFVMTAHVKQWLMLLQRCFDGSELLVGLLCTFCLTSTLRLVLPM